MSLLGRYDSRCSWGRFHAQPAQGVPLPATGVPPVVVVGRHTATALDLPASVEYVIYKNVDMEDQLDKALQAAPGETARHRAIQPAD